MDNQSLEKIAADILREWEKTKKSRDNRTLGEIDSAAHKEAAYMIAFAKPFNLEPNAEKILEKFCYQFFVDHATNDADENRIEKLRLILDELLKAYPCVDAAKIKHLCRYTVAAFLAITYIDDFAELSQVLND